MANVVYFGRLKKLTGEKEEKLGGTDVKDLLKSIKGKHGDEVYNMAKSSHIIVNEENATTLAGFKTKLDAEDIVKFLPVCGGGWF